MKLKVVLKYGSRILLGMERKNVDIGGVNCGEQVMKRVSVIQL
jgi:hypothetical protein